MNSEYQNTIFVDVSNISRYTKSTGIPRVTFEYLRGFYAIARQRSVSVLPVYVREDGLYDARCHLPDWAQDNPASEDGRFKGRGTQSLRAKSKKAAVRASLRLSGTAVLPLRLAGQKSKAKQIRQSIRRWSDHAQLTKIEVQPGDLLFMPAWWHDVRPSSYIALKSQGVRLVPLVHDMLPISRSEFYESPWRERFHDYVVTILSVCTQAIYISAATKNDAEATLQAASIGAVPNGVYYHGFDFALDDGVRTVRDSFKRFFATSRPKILMVSTIEPKKNYDHVLDEFRRLWWRGMECDLIIIGRKGWMAEAVISKILDHPHYGASLHWISDASDAELAFAYRHSDAFLSASIAEGFGLPVIEALSHKLPCLISDISVFQEIAGDHAVYFDPIEPNALSDMVERLLSEPSLLADLREKAGIFSWISWEQAAEKLFAELISILARPAETTLPKVEASPRPTPPLQQGVEAV